MSHSPGHAKSSEAAPAAAPPRAVGHNEAAVAPLGFRRRLDDDPAGSRPGARLIPEAVEQPHGTLRTLLCCRAASRFFAQAVTAWESKASL